MTNVLISFAEGASACERFTRPGWRVLLDSGAYANHTSKKPVVTLEQYRAYLLEHGHRYWRYFNLDVIGDPAQSARNLATLEEAGLKPIPVFQRGGTSAELKAMLARHELVGIGGTGVQHEVLDLRTLGQAAPSALTRSDIEVSTTGGMGGLPSTFTPGRNLVFLTLAASYALARGAKEIVTGVCQTDYSGYPDCRQDTIITLRNAIRLGTDVPDFEIKTPLMHLTKAQSVELAAEIGALDLLAESHTCYEGHRPACGKCPACVIRLRGFEQAGIRDPLQYAV